ncbi:MAG: hypothetical protein FWC47_14390 [Oscillospiraceae bacterium]|nr:hypothetical protein [Oscillospiraceae bacterium]
MEQLTIKINDNLFKELKNLSVDASFNINDYITDLINSDLKRRKEKLMDDIISENREAFKELAK